MFTVLIAILEIGMNTYSLAKAAIESGSKYPIKIPSNINSNILKNENPQRYNLSIVLSEI